MDQLGESLGVKAVQRESPIVNPQLFQGSTLAPKRERKSINQDEIQKKYDEIKK